MRTVLLAGGTGGAKTAHGLQQVLPPGDLTVVVNVADDMEWQGLPVSPIEWFDKKWLTDRLKLKLGAALPYPG